MLARGSLASLILWGPPGVGKTTIARLLAEAAGLCPSPSSRRCSPGVADLKRSFEEARQRLQSGAGHAAVRRRDPPLQPRPAGRLPAGGRERHRGAGGGDDGEPLLRAERRAAVALPGAGAAAAGRCTALERLLVRTEAESGTACRSTATRAACCAPWPTATGAICSTSRNSCWRCRRTRRRSMWPGSRTCWRAAQRSTTRTARSTTTLFRRCTRRCAAPTPTRRCTGSRAC